MRAQLWQIFKQAVRTIVEATVWIVGLSLAALTFIGMILILLKVFAFISGLFHLNAPHN